MSNNTDRYEPQDGRPEMHKELLRALNEGKLPFRHICECCGREELLTPEEAFQAGWDYPPRMGQFGCVSPRTCGNCAINGTLWWAIAMEHKTLDQLSRTQQAAMARILGEPWTLLDKSDRDPFRRA